MHDFSNFVVLTGVLIVIGLFLKDWEPPIKKQYIALSLGILGIALGEIMLESWAYGLLLAGLVFFKDKMVEEIKLVRNSASNIKNENEKGEIK